MRQRRWIRLASIVATLWVVTCSVAARTLTVSVDPPVEFRTIQAAIEEADDGDTVVVQPGTYTGPGNCDLAFNGKAITVRSTNGPAVTIVDGAGTGHGFYIRDDERGPARLEGFTLRRTIRGAVKCYSSSPPPGSRIAIRGHPGPKHGTCPDRPGPAGRRMPRGPTNRRPVAISPVFVFAFLILFGYDSKIQRAELFLTGHDGPAR